MNRNLFAFLDHNVERSTRRRLKIVRGLVRLYRDEQLAGSDALAVFAVPPHNHALGHGLAEFGHHDFGILHASLSQRVL